MSSRSRFTATLHGPACWTVERTISDARPEDYVGVLIPGRAKSPALLAEDPRVIKFVQDVSAQGGVIACICRGSLLAARSKVVAGRRMTGFNDSVSYPDLVVQPDAEAAGATWVQDAPVVVDHNLVTSPHPRYSAAFSAAIVEALRSKRWPGLSRKRYDRCAFVYAFARQWLDDEQSVCARPIWKLIKRSLSRMRHFALPRPHSEQPDYLVSSAGIAKLLLRIGPRW